MLPRLLHRPEASQPDSQCLHAKLGKLLSRRFLAELVLAEELQAAVKSLHELELSRLRRAVAGASPFCVLFSVIRVSAEPREYVAGGVRPYVDEMSSQQAAGVVRQISSPRLGSSWPNTPTEWTPRRVNSFGGAPATCANTAASRRKRHLPFPFTSSTPSPGSTAAGTIPICCAWPVTEASSRAFVAQDGSSLLTNSSDLQRRRLTALRHQSHSPTG